VVSNVLSTVSVGKGSEILQDRRFCTNLHWSGRHGKKKVLVSSGKQTPLLQPASGYFTELLPLLKQPNILGLDVKVKAN